MPSTKVRKLYHDRPLKELQPAPPAPPAPLILIPPLPKPLPIFNLESRPSSFLHLPPELRVHIYTLAVKDVTIHITKPTNNLDPRFVPHALLRTSRQVRDEVLPIVLRTCPVWATVIDFDFAGILTWLARITPAGEHALLRNASLNIRLHATRKIPGDLPTLRRWLHLRADTCRPQPQWNYMGPPPNAQIAAVLRRRVKRMDGEKRKQAELKAMAKGLGIMLMGEEMVVAAWRGT